MADSRDRFGEYGGKPGLIQTTEDGHVELTVKEKAMLGRIWGKQGDIGAGPVEVNSGVDVATGEKWEDAAQRRLALKQQSTFEKTNGRGPEEA